MDGILAHWMLLKVVELKDQDGIWIDLSHSYLAMVKGRDDF
jgi:hypothetical protein